MRFIEHNALDRQLPLDKTLVKGIAEAFAGDFAERAQWEFLPRMLLKERVAIIVTSAMKRSCHLLQKPDSGKEHLEKFPKC